jgi:hypothetical protein
MAKNQTQAVIVQGLFDPHRMMIIELAARHRLATMFSFRENTVAGGLIAYGPDQPELFKRVALVVDKILKGAKPADLPVEQPSKFELVIIASGKSRKGGRDVVTRKPFIAVQRVRLPPGKGEPASRKRALRGWWQHHSRSVGSMCLSPAVAPI